MNTMELQQCLSLTPFMAQCGTETTYRRALFRWHGSTAHRCQEYKAKISPPSLCAGRFDCSYRVRTYKIPRLNGTVSGATKAALRSRFLAVHLLTSSKNDVASFEGEQPRKVIYRISMRIKYKLMKAMMQREEMRQRNDALQFYDTCPDSERTGNAPECSLEKKLATMIAVQTEPNPTHTTVSAIKPRKTFCNDAMTKCSTHGQAPQAEVLRAELGWLRRFETYVCARRLIESDGPRIAAEIGGARWANVLLSNLRRDICRTHHTFKTRTYGRRYRVEVAVRFNRRLRSPVFMPRVLHAVELCKFSPDLLLRQPVHFSNRG